MITYFATPTLSRRDLLGSGAIAAGVVFCGVPMVAFTRRSPQPVVGFHRDAPFVDLTGRAEAFLPRLATDWTDALDDEALFRLGVVT